MTVFATIARSAVAAAAALVSVGAAQAQNAGARVPPAMPSAAAIDAEAARLAADPKRAAPFDEAARQARGLRGADGTAAGVAAPRYDPKDVDVEALARRYLERAEQSERSRPSSGLVVFVSLSMPRESLQRVIADAARIGAPVVMRGFVDGSMPKTVAAINALEPKGGVSVDPEAFQRYKVATVPSFALVRPGAEQDLDADGCALPQDYVSVAGDVTIDYALGHLRQQEGGKWAAMADALRAKLK